jgi:hypothetical protein
VLAALVLAVIGVAAETAGPAPAAPLPATVGAARQL